jgi:hypothetical protein
VQNGHLIFFPCTSLFGLNFFEHFGQVTGGIGAAMIREFQKDQLVPTRNSDCEISVSVSEVVLQLKDHGLEAL